MTTTIRFLGAAAYEITPPSGIKILLDPWLDENPVTPVKVADLEQVDLILVTHGAVDHLGDACRIAKKFDARVVCGPDTKARMLAEGVNPNKVLATAWGMAVDTMGINIRPVESRHWSMTKLPDGTTAVGLPLGMIITTEPGVRIWNGGDTALFSDIKLIGEMYRPNIGMMHVTLPIPLEADGIKVVTGELTPYEAVLATQWLGVEYVLPMHYLTPDCPEVSEYLSMLETMSVRGGPIAKPIVLSAGETWTYTPPAQ